MGKGYIFTGDTESKLDKKVDNFRGSMVRRGFNRKVSVSAYTFNHVIGKYRVIVDVCGTANHEIDAIARVVEDK